MKVNLLDVRLAFPDLFEAKQFETGSGPYSFRATFLLTPAHKGLPDIEEAIEDVGKAKWGAKWPAIKKTIEGVPQKYCLYEGDLKEYDGYAGNMVLSSTRDSTKGRPTVIGGDKAPLVAADGKPYGGCYVNAIVEFWAQDNKFGKGIRCTLLGVQFLRDGDAFTAGSSASADDFDMVDETTDNEALV